MSFVDIFWLSLSSSLVPVSRSASSYLARKPQTHRRERVCVAGVLRDRPGLQLLRVGLARLKVGDRTRGDPRAGRRGGEEGEDGDGGEEEGAEGEHSGRCCFCRGKEENAVFLFVCF